MKKSEAWLKEFLDEKYHYYNQRSFIEKDPISIPHQFTKKQDIEISGLLAATIAWGNRVSILKNANMLMELMDKAPYDFVMNHTKSDLRRFDGFKHRTFNGKDCKFFISSLSAIYSEHKDLEALFAASGSPEIKDQLIIFRRTFLKADHEKRSEKHISDPGKKSTAKRLCMFLRWMVRRDRKGVDFGIWKSISPAVLKLPLDVHSGSVSRKLGLLKRKQNDWAAVEEVTERLRNFDSNDPVKYDFALFGLGADKQLHNL